MQNESLILSLSNTNYITSFTIIQQEIEQVLLVLFRCSRKGTRMLQALKSRLKIVLVYQGKSILSSSNGLSIILLCYTYIFLILYYYAIQ